MNVSVTTSLFECVAVKAMKGIVIRCTIAGQNFSVALKGSLDDIIELRSFRYCSVTYTGTFKNFLFYFGFLKTWRVHHALLYIRLHRLAFVQYILPKHLQSMLVYHFRVFSFQIAFFTWMLINLNFGLKTRLTKNEF